MIKQQVETNTTPNIIMLRPQCPATQDDGPMKRTDEDTPNLRWKTVDSQQCELCRKEGDHQNNVDSNNFLTHVKSSRQHSSNGAVCATGSGVIAVLVGGDGAGDVFDLGCGEESRDGERVHFLVRMIEDAKAG
jgi:hypothetical protein